MREFLGWRKPSNPTMLVQDGKVLTGDQELAEAMLTQYKRKESEVAEALGEATEDYLHESRRMTKSNRAVFNFRKVTVKVVKQKIKDVDNKESFGHDKVSYGFLKKMSKWVASEITEIINLSLDVKVYPQSWKIARVKPLYKGDGCDRYTPKSFRPVALLAAVSRITESLLARQLDDFQEKHKLVHKGVHGFRRGRGTNTAMLEAWEYVLTKTEKGELVALDFLDMTAGFDTMVHLYLLKKWRLRWEWEKIRWSGYPATLIAGSNM